MHRAPPLFHRDIRWSNIIRSLHDPREWFLIDWEDASTLPTKAPLHFAREGHSPHVFSDGHGDEVDIWGVGQLIVESGVVGVSSEWKLLGEWMKGITYPSAQEALQKLESYQSSQVQ